MTWLEFTNEGLSYPYGCTYRFSIKNKDTKIIVGYIKWYKPWKKYGFWPCDSSVFDLDCLKEITEFLEKLREDHKKDLDRRKNL